MNLKASAHEGLKRRFGCRLVGFGRWLGNRRLEKCVLVRKFVNCARH